MLDSLWKEGPVVPGYGCDWDGLYIENFVRDSISGLVVVRKGYLTYAPIWLYGVRYDPETEEARLCLRYCVSKENDRIIEVTLPRSGVTASYLKKAVYKLHRFPAYQRDAKNLAHFFEHAERCCDDVKKYLPRTGWLRDGDNWYFALNGSNDLYVEPKPGMERLCSGFQPKGARSRQLEIIFDVLKHTQFAVIPIAAAFAAPLIHRLDAAESCIIDLHWNSSAGKTISAALATSIYGDPQQFIARWTGSVKGIEGKMSFCSDLPCHLDEAHAKENSREITEFVYNATNGIGRDLAKVNGNHKRLEWRTVVISTSEVGLLELSKVYVAGIDARIIPVHEEIFRGYNVKKVEQLAADLQENYGWIGAEYIEHLETKADFSKIHERYDHWVDELRGYVKNGDRIQVRKAKQMAVLLCAVEELQQLYSDRNVEISAAISQLLTFWEKLCESRTGSGVAEKALAALVEYYNRYPNRFSKKSTSRVGSMYQEQIGFFPEVFRVIVEKTGCRFDNVLEELAVKNWVLYKTTPKTGKKNFKIRTTINGENVKLLVVSSLGRSAYVDDSVTLLEGANDE